MFRDNSLFVPFYCIKCSVSVLYSKLCCHYSFLIIKVHTFFKSGARFDLVYLSLSMHCFGGSRLYMVIIVGS